jgi:(E)-2-((N-methylformamido)methylene)succinate hydrolase
LADVLRSLQPLWPFRRYRSSASIYGPWAITDAFHAAHPNLIRKRLEELEANEHASYAAAYEVFATGHVGDRIRAIRHKTLIVTGENDIGSNPRMARFMHESIPGSQLEILPELRHSVLLEAPETIARLLLEHFGR